MERLEILVEEKSMEELLRIFLPRILPAKWQLDENYFIRSFEGKNDLQKSLPKQVKAFSHFHQQVGVVVLQDQDSADCKELKAKLVHLISSTGFNLFKVRIVCKELESWYLGDFKAIKLAYPNFKSEQYQNKARFRNPDTCYASNELVKILPEFQKVSSAKLIAPHLNATISNSESFKQFVSCIVNFTS